MDEKVIAENAEWAAKTIQYELFNAGRKMDNDGALIIKEYLRRLLTDLFSGKDMTPDRINETFKAVYSEYKTSTPDEVINAANVIRDKFDKLIERLI